MGAGARAERCELVTVVGEPGVGKSRLVAEALDSIEARVVRGRCLPYGEGITYWPVIEVVKQLAALPSDPAAAAALRSLLGESEQGTSADQIAWAFRKLVEEQAPLVVCFDDIQWGEETFLDLVEATALLSAGAPILLLCMARPELLERRPAWPGVMRLEPLSADEADALIRDEVADDLRERIAHAAGGNPLFISEMLAMARERADVEVPPTLKALLAARLDQLDEPERSVLERGSVEGELFHRGAVQALAPEEAQVTARLTALVRRELVRPDRAAARGRGRVPLPPPADPRRCLRGASQERAGRVARALRRLARRARRSRRAGRDRRLPPRAGGRLPPRARAAGERPGRARRRAARRRRPASALARGPPSGERAARARAGADAAVAARHPARSRPGGDIVRRRLPWGGAARSSVQPSAPPRRAMRPARPSHARWPPTTGSTWASGGWPSSKHWRLPLFRCSSRSATTPRSSTSGTPSASRSRTNEAAGPTTLERASRHSSTRGSRASSGPGSSSSSSRLVNGATPADEALERLDRLLARVARWLLAHQPSLAARDARPLRRGACRLPASRTPGSATSTAAASASRGSPRSRVYTGDHEAAAASLTRVVRMARGARPARLSLHLRARSRPRALQARPLRGGGAARAARMRARGQRAT